MAGNTRPIPVWLVEGLDRDEPLVLGVYMSGRKAEESATAAEAQGYKEVTVTPYPANVRLWTGDGLATMRVLEAQLAALDPVAAAEEAKGPKGITVPRRKA